MESTIAWRLALKAGTMLSWLAVAGAAPAQADIPLAEDSCRPRLETVIDAEMHCSADGIDIQYYRESGIKVACLENQRVQQRCGVDGELTRERAFDLWQNRLTEFSEQCGSSGGLVRYEEPGFTEPNSASYCLQAQPEITVGAFEAERCNFRSLCPAIIVACEYPCWKAPEMAKAPAIESLSMLLAAAPIEERIP